MYSITLFSERLKQFRKAKKRSDGKTYRQKDLAEELGVTLDAVKSWEQARVWPSTENLLKLSNLFECDFDYFVGNIDEKTHDKQFIRDYTGLNDTAIDSLAKLNDVAKHAGFDIPRILSMLLDYSGFINVLIRLSYLRSYVDQLQDDVSRWQRIAEVSNNTKELNQATDDMTDALDRIGNIKYQIEREMNMVFSAFSYSSLTQQPLYDWIYKTRLNLMEKANDIKRTGG